MEMIKKYLELYEKTYQKFIYEKMNQEFHELINISQQRLSVLTRKLEMSGISPREIDKEDLLVIWFTIFTTKGKEVPKIVYDYKLLYHLLHYLMQEQEDYNQKLNNINGYENELKQLELEGEFVIVNKEKETLKSLLAHHEEACKIKLRIRLLNEAVNSIKIILESVDKFQRVVDNTKNWNNFDILSRGLLLSITKTPEFRNTETLVKELYYRGNKLMRTLKTINYYTNLQINLQEFKELYYYIENHLYDDLKEQESLRKVLDQAEHYPLVLTKLLETLMKYKDKYLQELLEIEKAKQNLFMQVIA
ncbi:MAG: hypothetical protein GX490_00250 [Bacilli bacterium]|nr:hypothetical protein [Bacilli bacterium]